MDQSADRRRLLIVGAGSLGGRVGRLWRVQAPGARVVAETRTAARHAALAADGLVPRLRAQAEPGTHPNVLLAVPASAVPDYRGEALRALGLWDRRGRLVMASSTAVYAASHGEPCVEGSPLAASERAERLLCAERPILDAGGSVIRLAGLYDADRGPQRVFLRQRSSPRRPDGLLNLIHYDDAAALCCAALERGQRAAIYLGCDGSPITRAELVERAAASGRLGAGSARCVFEGTTGPVGRRCNNRWTRAQLSWQPRFDSFAAWLAAEAVARSS